MMSRNVTKSSFCNKNLMPVELVTHVTVKHKTLKLIYTALRGGNPVNPD